MQVRKFVELAAAAAGISDRILFGAIPLKKGEPPLIAGTIDRLLTQTGHRPRFTTAEGIIRSVAEFQKTPSIKALP